MDGGGYNGGHGATSPSHGGDPNASAHLNAAHTDYAATHAQPAAYGPDQITGAPPAYAPQPGQGPAPEKQVPIQVPPPAAMPQHQHPAMGVNMVPGNVPNHSTPLQYLSGEAPQWIDCPFCHLRTQTIAKSEGSSMQYVASALCCFLCVCLVCVPQMAGWFVNITYTCSNCRSTVAMLPHDGPVRVYGPPTQSAYPTAPGQQPMPQQQVPQQSMPSK